MLFPAFARYSLEHILWSEAMHSLFSLALCLGLYLSMRLIMESLRTEGNSTSRWWLFLACFFVGTLSHWYADEYRLGF
jgi:hypothetical protein